MALFKRTPQQSPADRQRAAITDFWRWWATEGRALASGSIAGEVTTEALVAAMAPRVNAIDDGLAWELRPGTASRHLLTVTAAGVPELRGPARRWRAAAPAADKEWSFADTRQPIPDQAGSDRLAIAGRDYSVADVSVDAQVRGVEVDVSVHHPHFADLDDAERDQVAYLLLDQVLGEEAVETWVGEVTSSPVRALDPVPISGLRAVVRDLEAQHTEPDGSRRFALLQGEAPNGLPVLVLSRIPLRPATSPHLDTYVGIALPYTDRTPEGLPGPGSLDDLRALEDHVSERIGGSGEVVAVQSHDGLRVLHAYVDGTTPAAEQIRVAVQGWDQGAVQIEARPDPAWAAVRHLRG